MTFAWSPRVDLLYFPVFKVQDRGCTAPRLSCFVNHQIHRRSRWGIHQKNLYYRQNRPPNAARTKQEQGRGTYRDYSSPHLICSTFPKRPRRKRLSGKRRTIAASQTTGSHTFPITSRMSCSRSTTGCVAAVARWAGLILGPKHPAGRGVQSHAWEAPRGAADYLPSNRLAGVCQAHALPWPKLTTVTRKLSAISSRRPMCRPCRTSNGKARLSPHLLKYHGEYCERM